jgi:hypothetical protein
LPANIKALLQSFWSQSIDPLREPRGARDKAINLDGIGNLVLLIPNSNWKGGRRTEFERWSNVLVAEGETSYSAGHNVSVYGALGGTMVVRSSWTCIFCRGDSSRSRSQEHVVPQSLGNSLHKLPPGIVCDKCNQYFAIKVEKPVLDSEYFRHSRFRNAIPNKRGRIPPLEVVYGPNGEEMGMYKLLSGQMGVYALDECSEKSFITSLFEKQSGSLYVPRPLPPDVGMVSRLLAKMALEALAFKLYEYPGWDTEVVLRPEIDEIRKFARYGGCEKWSYHERRVYEEHKKWELPNAEPFEVLHEFDVLYTDWHELFAVIAILGVEYTINLGGPEIDGYERWLDEHDYQSWLYMKKGA